MGERVGGRAEWGRGEEGGGRKEVGERKRKSGCRAILAHLDCQRLETDQPKVLNELYHRPIQCTEFARSRLLL